ncbi:uncharacterized protein [Musca autumnalis]|uniref:uncharacterized protein n=1 Tax=Musca autumnalis TaxID=221902 RepID=UPI003CE67A5C
MKLRFVLNLTFIPTLYVLFILLENFLGDVVMAQSNEPLFEIPVQLIGFPVIVASVRLSQFAKKLAYSLNPNTYRGRSKRDTAHLVYDAEYAQKEIQREFGQRACILEEPCRLHASRPGRASQTHPNWSEIFSNYKVQSTGMKQWYLLSLFIGDAVRDVPLCRLLAKRMPCPGVGPLPPPQPR